MKIRILIFTPYYAPFFKAGGPVQSLGNLVALLSQDYDFGIYCSACDLGEPKASKAINPNQWQKGQSQEDIFYSEKPSFYEVKRVVHEFKPDLLYINGLFSFWFNLLPLSVARADRISVIVSPRGMLHEGALKRGYFKKLLYLKFFEFVSSSRATKWQATDDQEVLDIQRYFGAKSRIVLAHNVPKQPYAEPSVHFKSPVRLELIYLSLINSKKNLYLLLEAISALPRDCVHLSICGVVHNLGYWSRCQEFISQRGLPVSFEGPIAPDKVQERLSYADYFVLLSEGENFGHAIYESLSVGTPVIISPFTPWTSVKEIDAGFICNLNIESVIESLKRALANSSGNYFLQRINAHRLSLEYYNQSSFATNYRKLFVR